MPFIMYQTDFQVGTKSFQVLFRHSRRVFTSGLRKSVRFFVIMIFLIIKTLPGLKPGQYPVRMTRKPRKGDLKS